MDQDLSTTGDDEAADTSEPATKTTETTATTATTTTAATTATEASTATDTSSAAKSNGTAASTPFGDNWRDQIVAGLPEDQRGKAQAWLKTRSSPFEILRAGMSADQRISEITRERVKLPTGKGDDPKEVAAFRKAWGIPEKAEDYKVEMPKEYGALSEFDTELRDEFLTGALEHQMSQKQVEFANQMYWAMEQRKQAAQAATIAKVQQAAVDELHVEFGREYRPTVELINRMFETELSAVGLTEADQRREFLSQRFANGMALGEYPPFVKMMAKIARERADDGAFVMGEASDGVDLDSKIDKIIGTRNTDVKEYERLQPELQRLIAAQNRRKARG